MLVLGGEWLEIDPRRYYSVFMTLKFPFELANVMIFHLVFG